jgi:hypothetical protein
VFTAGEIYIQHAFGYLSINSEREIRYTWWLHRASSSLKYQHVKGIVVLVAKLYGRDVLFGRSDCCIVGGCGLREHPLLSRNATLASRFKSCVTNIYRNSHSEQRKGVERNMQELAGAHLGSSAWTIDANYCCCTFCA